MVLIMHTMPLLGSSPMRISIGIKKALKVVLTLRKDTDNCIQIALQALPEPALHEL
jgi:hypothetical protein